MNLSEFRRRVAEWLWHFTTLRWNLQRKDRRLLLVRLHEEGSTPEEAARNLWAAG